MSEPVNICGPAVARLRRKLDLTPLERQMLIGVGQSGIGERPGAGDTHARSAHELTVQPGCTSKAGTL
jgi:hypothetical protein